MLFLSFILVLVVAVAWRDAKTMYMYSWTCTMHIILQQKRLQITSEPLFCCILLVSFLQKRIQRNPFKHSFIVSQLESLKCYMGSIGFIRPPWLFWVLTMYVVPKLALEEFAIFNFCFRFCFWFLWYYAGSHVTFNLQMPLERLSFWLKQQQIQIPSPLGFEIFM